MTRIACVAVPLFPLAARLRCEPELIAEGLAVFAGNGNTARVIAATRTARQAGVRPGMTLPQARALLPKLVSRGRDAESERAAREALLEAVETFSPRIEEGEDGVVYLDIAGLDRHFPANSTDASERQLGITLAATVESVGLPARIGIASGKLAARLAAQQGQSPTLVPEGKEAQFLAPLPLARLAPELGVATMLEHWGVRSIGDLARLPRSEVASRLGPAGRQLHAIARGLDPRPISPRQPPPTFREGMNLEWPLVALEPLLFVARAALDRLCSRLETRGCAANRLEISFRLEPDGHHERAIHLPAPTTDRKTLLTLLRLDVESTPPPAPVAGFTLAAHPDQPRTSQLSLLGPTPHAPEQLATTIARLFALLGPGRVGSPRTVDGHLPERFRLVDYDPPPPPKIHREARQGRGLLAVRVVRPPLPIEVITEGEGALSSTSKPSRRANSDEPCAESRANSTSSNNSPDLVDPVDPVDPADPANQNRRVDFDTEIAQATEVAEPAAIYDAESSPLIRDRPRSIQTPITEETSKRLRIQGRVRVAAGPWSLEDAWWSDRPIEREYWDVEIESGGIYRIYRDRTDGNWFADGIYD